MNPTLEAIRVADIVPPGAAGIAAVEHFTITQADADQQNWRLALHPGTGLDTLKPGRYARLRIGGEVMMSDTPMERLTNWQIVHKARGDVLVVGLGLGLILYPMIANPAVTSITVVELFQPVIDLVWSHVVTYRDRRGWRPIPRGPRRPQLEVIRADIFNWQPPAGAKWDVIYFDIWPTRSLDNLPQIAKLHQRFKARKRPGGWMGSWYADLLRAQRAEERDRW